MSTREAELWTEGEKRTIQDWQLAKERANRHNRNFLQYGAAFAATGGVVLGSGSIFALADALRPADEPSPLLAPMLLGAGGVGVLFALLALTSFIWRFVEEHRADRGLAELIRLTPERFLPKAD